MGVTRPADDNPAVAVGAPGAEEAPVVAWPMLVRRRLAERFQQSSRYPQLVLVAAMYGLFSVGFTITLLTVSVPTIADDLNSTSSTITWVITGPLLVFGITGPIVGKLGDLHGQKRVYVIGLAISGIASFAVAASWNATSLIVFRIIAAAAGAACGPASMAMINSVFPPDRRVQALSYWSMVNAGAPVLGVIAGGPVVEALSWRIVFLVQAPLVLFGVLLAGVLLPDTPRRQGVALDLRGAFLMGVSATSLLLALNRGPVMGWGSPLVVTGFVLAPVAAIAFVSWERRVEHPLIRLEYLRRRNVAAPIAAQACTSFAYMGSMVLTPLFLHDVFDYGETRIGLLSVGRPLAFSLVSPLAGYLAVRQGERVTGMLGAATLGVSMLLMANVDAAASDVVLIAWLAVGGIGQGTSVPSMVATVANAVDDADLGVVAATQQLGSTVAVVAGVQILQTLQAALAENGSLLDSYHAAYLLAAVMCGLGIVAASAVRRSGTAAEQLG